MNKIKAIWCLIWCKKYFVCANKRVLTDNMNVGDVRDIQAWIYNVCDIVDQQEANVLAIKSITEKP